MWLNLFDLLADVMADHRLYFPVRISVVLIVEFFLLSKFLYEGNYLAKLLIRKQSQIVAVIHVESIDGQFKINSCVLPQSTQNKQNK
jgi:hypothetical protein